jgi:NADH:ubiquinone oxidoreductase subunit E
MRVSEASKANGHKAPAVPPEVAAAVAAALAAHGAGADALVPVLSAVNRALGYLSPDALAEVGRRLHLPQSRVHGAATFYTMLSTKPRGRHLVQFCENAPCHVVGGRQVWRALRRALDLAPGETTADGRFTLVTTSCIGACSVGPVVIIDDDVHGNVSPDKIDALLARYV